MLVRMLVIAVILFVALGSGTTYLGLRLSAGLSRPWGGVVWALLVLNAAQIPAAFLLMRLRRTGPGWDRLRWSANIGLGVFSLLFAFALFVDVGRAALGLLDVGVVMAGGRALLPADVSGLAPLLSLGVVGLTGLVSVAGYRAARRVARVERVDIPITGLHPDLDGFQIVQISDLHVGQTVHAADLAAVVQRVNVIEPDLVAITGDLVDGLVEVIGEQIAPLAGLRAEHGVFFVTGNHEYYSGVHAWLVEVAGLGITSLINAHRLVQVGDARLLVAGITDHQAGRLVPEHRPDPAAAIAGAPPSDLRVLLAHQPRSAACSVGHGFDLMLCGHTHGGQYLPWTALVRMVEPFAVGLHRLEQMWIYTNRGTGYWGPPNRLGAPSEITLLTLRQGAE